MTFLSVKNWDQFQQYKDRDPKRIKVHRDLLYDYEFDRLDEVDQAHLLKIWLLAAKVDNKIPNDADWIARQIGAKSKVDINQLCTIGFLVAYESVQACTETYLEAETEEEVETEEETEKSRESCAKKTRAPAARGKRLNTDWKPNESLLAWARDKRPDLAIHDTIESFVDYWTAKAGASATKLDWDATFRNWVKNEKRTNNGAATGRETVQERIARQARESRLRAGGQT